MFLFVLDLVTARKTYFRVSTLKPKDITKLDGMHFQVLK